MAVSRRGIVIEIIGDERSYLRAAGNTIATNTKLDSSFRTVGVNAKAAADVQIAAAVKSSEALRVNALQMSTAASRVPAGAGRDAALVAAAAAQDKYNRSIGQTTTASAEFSSASKTAERDLGKATRGALAGAGAAVGLGRSLAFASGGFLAFAGAATLIRSSITGAEALKKAQEGLAVAIEHTHGNLGKLEPQYAATAEGARRFGINEADATTALERATVLTGGAVKAQRAYQEALVISKATGKDFNAVLTATSKGQEGVTTSLQRYGIMIAKGTPGQQQFVTVMARFAGQAKANTSAQDQFRATLANSEEIIGTALLPTIRKYLGELGNWLAKMNESGRLQKDVTHDLHVAGDVFHAVGRVIGTVDKVTGSFANTLKLLLTLKFASLITGWIGNLEQLALKWGVVRTAAQEATAAEATAVGGSALVGAGLGTGVEAGAITAGSRSALSSREAAAANNAISKSLGRSVETSVSTGLAAGVAAGAATAGTKLGGLKASLASLASKPIAILIALTFIPPSKGGQTFLDKLGLGTLGRLPLVGPLDQEIARFIHSQYPFQGKPPEQLTPDTRFKLLGQQFAAGTAQAYQALTTAGAKLPDIANVTAKQELKAAEDLNKAAQNSKVVAKRVAEAIRAINDANAPLVQPGVVTPEARKFPRTGDIVPPAFQLPGLSVARPPNLPPPLPRPPSPPPAPFGGAQPIPVYKTFSLTLAEQVTQAKAALTKSNADDVAAAKRVVARIKRLIDRGHLAGNSLIQALQAEASALGTIWSAEDAAAQKRAQAAAAARARIQQQLENSIDPLKLEVALSRAQALGKPLVPYLKALRAAAEKALATGKLSLAQQKEAYDQISSLNQQIKDAAATATATFSAPARLQLALARDAALGIDQTKDLLKLKAAILRFIRTHKNNIQALIDAYNQLAQVNQQLGSSAQSALGGFKQVNTRELAKGLGLTADQIRRLRGRLSQLGPGQTVPESGTGAAGYVIDPETGRPVRRHHRRRRHPGHMAASAAASTATSQRTLNRLLSALASGKAFKIEDNRPIIVRTYVNIDGRRVAENTTRHQQMHRRRNPHQRRGPHAGPAYG